MTTYVYDEAGRMTHSITETEPEWNDDERAWAMTLVDVNMDACSGCGQPLSETLSIEAYEGYEAGLPAVCQGCKALHSRQSDYAEDKDLGSLRFSVRRTWRNEEPDGHRADHFPGPATGANGTSLPPG